MPKSCIKFKVVKDKSELHNTRKFKPLYLVKNSNKNLNVIDCSVAEKLKDIKKRYESYEGGKTKKKQKWQSKSKPIWEAVVLLENDNNNKNYMLLTNMTDKLKERFGITAFQWHIHNDEGHQSKEDDKIKYNYHAHILFDMTDKNGRRIKLVPNDFAEMQTIVAECLNMERGEENSIALSLNHMQFKAFLQIRDDLKKELKRELTEKEEKEIRSRVKNLKL